MAIEQDPWLDHDEQRFWRRWVTVTGRLPAQLHRELQGEGLSLPDFEVLVNLTEADDGRVRVTDLAAALGWERSRVSHHVTRMERRGLVRRAECSEDGRGAFVVVTAAGRAAIEGAAPAHVRSVRRLVLDALTREELAVLETALGRILDRLDEQPEVTGSATGPCG